MKDQTILLLGCTSWIGFKLSQQLVKMGYEVVGTSRTIKHNMRWLKHHYSITTPSELKTLIKNLQPQKIINLLRGEDDEGWNAFRSSIEPTCHYTYLSSSLALDGYDTNIPLTDTLSPKAKSAYGIFKAECEKYLNKQHENHLIIRFNSIHGFTSHKTTRTQLFLEKLKSGREITVHKGVIQSRLYDEDFINLLLKHIQNETTGTLHFASNDKSEELKFLQELADKFGYSRNAIIPGKDRSLANALVPSKYMFINQKPYKLDDEILLCKLKSNSGLLQHISSGDI